MTSPAGPRNALIVIHKPNTAKDVMNRPVSGTVLHKAKYASVRSPSGMQSIRDESNGGVPSLGVAYSFRVNFDESITEAMTVEHRGRMFNIKRVIQDFDHKQHTDLVCELGNG